MSKKILIPVTERTSEVKVAMQHFLDEFLPEGCEILSEPELGNLICRQKSFEVWQMQIRKRNSRCMRVVYYLHSLNMALEAENEKNCFVRLLPGTVIAAGRVGEENGEIVLYCLRPQQRVKYYENACEM